MRNRGSETKRKPRALKSYILMAGLGCLAGILTRLTDFFPYDSLWSLSSIATLFGFWMVTVTLVVLFSRSNRNAAVNVMLYLTAMNISFYLLKYILGLFLPMFDNEGFHWNLLVLYTALACLCSIGGFVLYVWNKGGSPGSFLYGLPIGGLGAETTDTGERIEIVQESQIDNVIPDGTVIRLGVKTEKINIFAEDGTRNLLEGVHDDNAV